MTLKILRQQIAAQLRKNRSGALDFFGLEEVVPDVSAANIFKRVPSGEFASAVETHDPARGIENGNERSDGIENCGDHVAFLLQSSLGVLQIGDVEGNAVDEPGRSVGVAHHTGIAVEPDHAAVPCNHAVGGAKRLAREKHTGRFNAPALLVVGMNSVIPADRIFEPLFARVAERCFDLRADVCLADATIEIRHEDDGWNLLQKRSITALRDSTGAHLQLVGYDRLPLHRSMKQIHWPAQAEVLRPLRHPEDRECCRIQPRAAEGGLPIQFAQAMPSIAPVAVAYESLTFDVSPICRGQLAGDASSELY